MISVLSLELTERCNIRCAHCLVGCEPTAGRTMCPSVVSEAVEAAAELGIPLLSASGGEPLLARPTLNKLLEEASEVGIPVRMVTNASWAKTEAKTRVILERLATLGLTHLSISADPYHQEYVPLENVKRIVSAAQDLPIRPEINLVLSRDDATLTILETTARWDVPIAITPIVHQGRARELRNNLFFSGECFIGCQVVRSPGVDVEGTVNVCCNMSGHLWRATNPQWPFRISHADHRGIRAALERHDNTFTRRLMRWGPMLMATLVAKRLGESVELSGPCEACAYLSANVERTQVVESLEDDELQDALPWDSNFRIPIRTGWHRLVPDIKVIKFSMSGHLSESGVATYGHILTFSCANGCREFLLLDSVSAEEVKIWIAKVKSTGAVHIDSASTDASVLDEVRRWMLYGQLIETGALTRVRAPATSRAVAC